MAGRGDNGRRARTALAWATALAFAFGTAGAPVASAANGPFEPNDSAAEAAGPLAFGGSYEAALETPGDTDFYSFYVTSPEPAAVSLAFANLGGGTGSPQIGVTIVNGQATPLGMISFLSPGGEQTLALNLPPQKYFVEVAANPAFNAAGDAYRLTAGGGKGAFGPYEAIAVRCTAATRSLAAGRRRQRRAQGKLQRTTARLRITRYGAPRARRRALRAQRRARRRLRAARRAIRAARRARHPWCEIPQ